ncbi:NAD(P)-dependent dehydrogenase, short-chain alcohol dehydrogenase family [Cryobacterium psychrotolerans]|uniref:NAD(P)-dependent dehydrogenase, short-chain alcohol dehydrogenase family n=1 Tax=Cryobacterium psychrotolerans TaxID=386301 RepID=A0A1G9FXD2_9MICO|nr:SDR family oxidoreductase [Cryobacterium psychrotolerans]TFD90561.1 SDR family oxidoreductase [Cryobacterium psychrotolerans]SDK93008.1 NAD(P)-dependent dehydrogenase, short-chain alcohol dehydrogenase family [Cryobacterium psychrotolerans]
MPENPGHSYPDLEGKVVLVTGAAQGMGAAHARRLSASGATVAVNDREASAELAALAAELSGLAVPGDVSDPDQVRALVQRVEQELGPVDVLVANHAFMTMGPFLDADPEDWWKVIDTNLGGTFHLVQAVLPGMRRRGAGRIVVISSEWGVTGWPDATAYSASKAGLISLVKTLGRELAPEGIIVNAVAPGVTDTPQLEVDAGSAGISLDEMRAVYAGSIPLGRIGTSPEIAAAVALLCDFRLSAIIGQVVQVNGGSTRGRA